MFVYERQSLNVLIFVFKYDDLNIRLPIKGKRLTSKTKIDSSTESYYLYLQL